MVGDEGDGAARVVSDHKGLHVAPHATTPWMAQRPTVDWPALAQCVLSVSARQPPPKSKTVDSQRFNGTKPLCWETAK